MTPELIDEVWSMVDRDALAALTSQGPRCVFATISGAHLYGFPSADSDVDLRGAFMNSARDMLSIDPPPETITIEDKGAYELDWVAHDIRKFAKMMTKHNGYVLEQLYSPLVVVHTEAFEELRALGQGCITRPTVRHYQGFARGRVKRLEEEGATVKHLLYAYRVYMSGIHLMQTGKVESNVVTLNELIRVDGLGELIERKRSGAEKMRLQKGEVEDHRARLEELERKLADAHDKSGLPMEATSREALNDFVVRLRLSQ